MNNIALCNSFYFNLFQLQKFHTSDYTKGAGAPANFIAKLIYGSAVVKSKQGNLTLNEGDVFYIPRGMKYQSFWYTDAEERVVWYSFGFDAFPTPNEYQFSLQKIPCNEKTNQLLETLCQDITVNCTSVGLLYQFIGATFHAMKKDYHPYHRIAEKALDYMQKTSEFTMKDVAGYCNISESGLYPIFQKVFQKTPLEMKQEILCEKAVQLLTTTDLSVEEISNRLLFSSSSYFRKVLKKYTGKTPLKIRSEAQF